MFEAFVPENFGNYLGISIFIFLIVFAAPQVWREDEPMWFMPIKFWFGIMPFMLGVVWVFTAIGPIYAVMGLFVNEREYVHNTYFAIFLIFCIALGAILDRFTKLKLL